MAVKRNRRRRASRSKKRRSVRSQIRAALNRNIETKTSLHTSTDGEQIFHNNFVTLTNAPLETSQGITDPEVGHANNRIGDKVNLRGVSFKMMIELNERYSDVTFRLMLIKAARNDVPTRDTLFNGLSGNKMLDTINTERFSVMSQRWFKMKSPNTLLINGADATTQGINGYAPGDLLHVFPLSSGVNTGTHLAASRATKIVKMWVPGRKFVKSGVITYDNGGSKPKFFDYHLMLYAYANYSTLQDVFYVGRVNEFQKIMYYKDA